jgi:hypothetical protein
MKSRRAKPVAAEPQAEETRAAALAAITRFARVLALTGISRKKMASAFQDACARLPESLFQSGRTLNHELLESGHVLSVWLSDPNYLDQDGQPRAIRLRGASPSLEALIDRVSSELQIDQVVKYLLRTGSISKVGRRYAVRRTSVSVSRDPELAYAHGLQTVLALLHTIENNAPPIKDRHFCFEYTASNRQFPTRLRAEFDTRLRRLGTDFLRRLDADMSRAEDSRRPGEPTLRMTVGLFQSEENNHRSAIRAPRASARKSGRK